jgi:hypothetical protein
MHAHSALLQACTLYHSGVWSAPYFKVWLWAHNVRWSWEIARVLSLCGGA